jgi:carbon-monoxide dehydrogenase small subunit
MKIAQSFQVAQPVPAVWALFLDVPAVAALMPGAELTEDRGEGVYAGRVTVKLGPFNASFEGEAALTSDPFAHRGRCEGKGIDKRGGSRSKLVLDFRLSPVDAGTRVDLDADVQLAGPIAQFGRTGVVSETAAILIGQFAKNVEAKLATAEADSAGIAQPVDLHPMAREHEVRPPNPIGGFKLLLRLLSAFFARLAGRGRRQGDRA